MKPLSKILPIFVLLVSCCYAGRSPSSWDDFPKIVYNHDNNWNNIGQVININLTNYSNIPVISVTQSELEHYEIFNYLHNNTINDQQPNEYYFDRMAELANSLLQLNSDIENNNITPQRTRILRSYFGEILDYIVTEAWRRYLHSNNLNIANIIDSFRALYYQVLDNNYSITNDQIIQMYNIFVQLCGMAQ